MSEIKKVYDDKFIADLEAELDAKLADPEYRVEHDRVWAQMLRGLPGDPEIDHAFNVLSELLGESITAWMADEIITAKARGLKPEVYAVRLAKIIMQMRGQGADNSNERMRSV